MSNRLAQESSPYLLQHKDNPVDWFPWGDEAIARARSGERPLLVSIGYSACHWCHVMERESFEDPAVATLMNERFVPIKVDREERPDIDAICMEVCQALTGQGGWPLNAFLTPTLQPFYAGTYFPPEPRSGMPSWRMVLEAVADAWEKRHEQVVRQGAEIARSLGATARLRPSAEPIRQELLSAAVSMLGSGYDSRHGGWGGAPKFPQASVIELLLARGEREMARGTLEAMARGGIYDQVGGGFARYAVDAAWSVPHFEKMLYDNALLARAYLHGWQVSRVQRLQRVCCETLDWALREMRGPEAGFYSALDADSDGEEGKFYVWTAEELREVLGERAGEAIEYFGAREGGNFEHGTNVLQAVGPEPADLDQIRAQLYEARRARVRPGLDDKRLTGWNALMISALAEAGGVLERPDYVEAAIDCTNFLLSELRDGDRRLLRTWKDGRGRIEGYLDDHAFLLEALLTLYEATFEPRFYREAVALAEQIIERFSDPERGGFFTTASDREPLVARRKDLEDSPIPSGNSSAAFGLLRLALLSGEGRYEQHALGVLRLLLPLGMRQPLAFGHLLRAVDFYLAPVREVAIVGPGAGSLVRAVRAEYRPHLVLAGGEDGGTVAGVEDGGTVAGGEDGGTETGRDDAGSDTGGPDEGVRDGGVPLLKGREPVDGRAAAYVCEHFVCKAPVTTPEELAASLQARP